MPQFFLTQDGAASLTGDRIYSSNRSPVILWQWQSNMACWKIPPLTSIDIFHETHKLLHGLSIPNAPWCWNMYTNIYPNKITQSCRFVYTSTMVRIWASLAARPLQLHALHALWRRDAGNHWSPSRAIATLRDVAVGRTGRLRWLRAPAETRRPVSTESKGTEEKSQKPTVRLGGLGHDMIQSDCGCS